VATVAVNKVAIHQRESSPGGRCALGSESHRVSTTVAITAVGVTSDVVEMLMLQRFDQWSPAAIN